MESQAAVVAAALCSAGAAYAGDYFWQPRQPGRRPRIATCRDPALSVEWPMRIETFTGGIFDTNCFLLPDHGVLIDAPQDCAAWLTRSGTKIDLLLLTHGHIDHVTDAARIKREHGCRVAYHPDGLPMLTDPHFFKRLGLGWEIEPVEADFFVRENEEVDCSGLLLRTFEVPGHCPGSLCFYEQSAGILFGGDVLFAGGVGRWDLPGGDRDLLFSGIRNKLFPLGDHVRVLPGHGPATSIGVERATNPFLLDT